MGSCAKCGGTDLIDGVRLKPTSSGSVDEVFATVAPTSGMFRRETTAPVRATICATCGYTELYTYDLAELAARWQDGAR